VDKDELSVGDAFRERYEILTADGRVVSPPEHPDYVNTIPVTE